MRKDRAETTYTAELHSMPKKKSIATDEMLEEKTPPPGRRSMLNLEEFIGELKISL